MPTRDSLHLFHLGLDLGGTRIKAALADGTGEVVAEGTVETASEDGVTAVLDRMAALVEELRTEAGSRARIGGIGVGCPGLLDRARRRVLFLPNLAGGWRDVELAAELERRVGVPAFLLNDARLSTLGEWVFGHGRELDATATMVAIAVGTGVGGGLVVAGRLHLGSDAAAGEIGHMVLDPQGPSCGCGGRGCLEVYASAPAIVGEATRMLRGSRCRRLAAALAGDLAALTAQMVAEAAGDGDVDAALVLAGVGRALGLAIANLVHVLAPDRVVLGGGVALAGDALWQPLRETVGDAVRLVPFSTDAIVLSALGDRAGTFGGIALAARAGRL
jgi:glucokinase